MTKINAKLASLLDVELIARGLAQDGDDIQATFFNDFGKELLMYCKGERNFETQCCAIERSLNINGKAIIKELMAFIDLDEKSGY